MSEANKAMMRRFYDEVVNKGNLDEIDARIAQDLIEHNPPPGVPSGPEGMEQSVAMFRAAFPDIRVTIHDTLAEGDKVVVRATASGTHRGELMGIPATGRRIAVDEIHIVRCIDGKVVEHWGVEDSLGMMQQLGLAESPPRPS